VEEDRREVSLFKVEPVIRFRIEMAFHIMALQEAAVRDLSRLDKVACVRRRIAENLLHSVNREDIPNRRPSDRITDGAMTYPCHPVA
jgi:hypothetical protein